MTTPLSALAGLISSGVQTLELAYSREGLSFPALDDPFKPGVTLDNDPALKMTARTIVAAATQIIAMVSPPVEHLLLQAMAMYTPAMLDVVNQTHVANVLSGAGPQGMKAEEISVKTGIEASQISRVLRYLSFRHIFKEIRPNVFANNKLSSLLIKPALLKDPNAESLTQYDEALAAAAVGHSTDEALKSSPYISAFLLGGSNNAASPFNMAMKTPLNIWEWFEEPNNVMCGRRFINVMKHVGDSYSSAIYTSAVDWKSLKETDVVVDVGGGVGPVTLMLHKEFPHIQYVVQDLQKTIEASKKFWNDESRSAIIEGKVKLEVHDFFTPQPIRNAAVYFVRQVLHDWPQLKAIEILKNIRTAAGPTSKLVVFEMVASYACVDPDEGVEPVPGNDQVTSLTQPPPFPLLQNYAFGPWSTTGDMQMLNLMNGMERTVSDFSELGKRTGWRLESVKRGPLSTLVFSPV